MLMVAGRGIAQLITEGQIVTFDTGGLAKLGSSTLMYLPMSVVIALSMLIIVWLLTRKTALGLFIESVGINLRLNPIQFFLELSLYCHKMKP